MNHPIHILHKKHLVRLPAAVRSALKQAQQRQTPRAASAARKCAEEALREAESRYRTIADFTWDWEFLLNPERHFVYVSPSCEGITGYAPGEFLGSDDLFQRIAHPEDADNLNAEIERAFSLQIQTGFDFRIVCRDGTIRWVSMAYQPITDPTGTSLGVRGSIRDIADRKRVEEALRESECRFRSIVEQSADGIVLANEQGNIVEWNGAQERITGLKRSEAVEHPVWDVLFQTLSEEQKTPTTFEHLRASTLEFLRTGQMPWLNQLRETDIQRPDGTRRSVQALMFPIKMDRGFMSGSISRDITERKRAEEALRESEERYRLIAERVDDIVWQLDLGLHFVYVSPAVKRVLGYTPQETRGLYVVDLLDEDGLAQMREILQNRLKREMDLNMPTEYRMRHKDGRWVDVEVLSSPLFDTEGHPTGFVGITRDIGVRKRAEEALRKHKEELQTILDSVPALIFYKDLDNRMVRVNRSWVKTFGWAEDKVVGKSLSEFFPQKQVDQFFRDDLKVLTSGQPKRNILEVIETGHGKRWFTTDKIPYRDEHGNIVGIIGFAEDITERKRAEEERERLFQEVQRARAQLQALSRRLVEAQETERRFIARELHDEVGQILTGLKMLLETSSHLPADTLCSRLSNAQSLVERLMEQVQGMSLDLRPTMLDDLGLLPALLWLTKRFADQTGVRVHLEHAGLDRRFAPEIETAVYRITQEALTNVARHAGVKEVTARLWVTPDTLDVQVEDRGQGFHVEAAQAAPTSSGLSGMRERAVALGGDLSIESTPGVGTRVTFQVPLSGG
ncbi:MAG: PAS domain S-box protein [Chloroflexi bacterium]|nr:PAS domain S-box protein [Chloroflexota bacterium]